MVVVVDNPTRQTFVVEMVGPELLTNAVSLNSAIFNLARIAGPALAGALIVVHRHRTALLRQRRSRSWGQSWRSLLMRPANCAASSGPREAGKIRQGLEYVRQRPELILPMVVIAFVATFGMNIQVTTALFATNVFHGAPAPTVADDGGSGRVGDGSPVLRHRGTRPSRRCWSEPR